MPSFFENIQFITRELETDRPCSEIVLLRMTGYASEASFSHAFSQWAGMTPGAYRRRARDGALTAQEPSARTSRAPGH